MKPYATRGALSLLEPANEDRPSHVGFDCCVPPAAGARAEEQFQRALRRLGEFGAVRRRRSTSRRCNCPFKADNAPRAARMMEIAVLPPCRATAPLAPALHEVQFCKDLGWCPDRVRLHRRRPARGCGRRTGSAILHSTGEKPRSGVTGPKSSRRSIASSTTTSVATGLSDWDNPEFSVDAFVRRPRGGRRHAPGLDRFRTYRELERRPDGDCLCGAPPGASISPRPLWGFRAGLAEAVAKRSRCRVARGVDYPDAARLGAGQPGRSADPDNRCCCLMPRWRRWAGSMSSNDFSSSAEKRGPAACNRLETSMSSTFCRPSPHRRFVLHCRNDAALPFDQGQLIASRIPRARFVTLESRNPHPLASRYPAWAAFRSAEGAPVFFMGGAPTMSRAKANGPLPPRAKGLTNRSSRAKRLPLAYCRAYGSEVGRSVKVHAQSDLPPICGQSKTGVGVASCPIQIKPPTPSGSCARSGRR